MEEHEHEWSMVACTDKDGRYVKHCTIPGCTFGLTLFEQDGIFPTEIDGVALDIIDDPVGGVSKIIMYELIHSYHLPSIDLELGDVVIDIGAHVGVISIFMAKKYPDARVLAFEPIEANYSRLVENIARNKVENVEAHKLAITKDGRAVKMAVEMNVNSGGGHLNDKGEPAGSITLSDVFKGFDGRCKLLKIDCEGAEYEIFENSLHLLDRVDYLVIELHGAIQYQHALLNLIRKRVDINKLFVTSHQ